MRINFADVVDGTLTDAWPQLRTTVRVHPATFRAWNRGY
jgi:hypothetical protein